MAGEVDEGGAFGVGLGPGEEKELEGGVFVFGGVEGGEEGFEVVDYDPWDAVVVGSGVVEDAEGDVILGSWFWVGHGGFLGLAGWDDLEDGMREIKGR